MKKIFLAIATIAVCLNLSAQPPMGGGRPGGGGGRPPRGEYSQRSEGSSQIGITKLPEIEGLTDQQREKLVKALTDERMSVMKLNRQKHQLQREVDSIPNSKNAEKNIKNINKIDIKIQEEQAKYNKKIRSILSVEQYAIFNEKRNEIEFSRPERRSRPDGERRGGRGNRPDREGTPPNMPMNSDFDNE
ncbi:Spy/CpxP family protein refolding chaperone [Dysgonomonas alginatilytica]|uniref:Spy/CpxP family protein refolding chaperone n=1 Tax=Dysgonomonas alginatilytica TaxID=1605892 RepID=A0A2V3PQ36_9BACT|nr:hypothetical protein [Dysgonomonas alginatilytica]PXV58900.1 Spy/CpxP family protein refolding chaperone [Dysgonomonas alginatilytica]